MNQQIRYEEVVILGVGKIAEGVLEQIVVLKEEYGYDILYINNGDSIYNPAKNYARKVNVPYIDMKDVKKLTGFFSSITKTMLIISAGSYYLFPRAIVEMDNLQIINFHNSLLPDYRGRNIPSWVIYNNEKRTGITWHYVAAGVDDGAIIHQEYCSVDEDEKAYRLSSKLMDLGIAGFKKCIHGILNDAIEPTLQSENGSWKIYYSKEVPGNARCTSNDAPDDIYRLLRAVDYGKANIFPKVTLMCQGMSLRIVRYAKIEEVPVEKKPCTMHFFLSDGKILQIKYEEIVHTGEW